MGNAEGEFRGDNDVILTAAIEKMSDAEFEATVKALDAKGILGEAKMSAADFGSKFDMITQLDKFPTEVKVDMCEAIKAGENPLEDE